MGKGTFCKVLEGCSKLEAGTVVVVLGHSKSSDEYYCIVKEGLSTYWIRSDLLELIEEGEENAKSDTK